MSDDERKRGPSVRRKHGQRVKVTATKPGEFIITVRLGDGVVLDCEPLPEGFEVSRVDEQPQRGGE